MSEAAADRTTPYRVLARKYRPRDFTALIGQEPMVTTLSNAFRTGRIAQAWMLTGVRGVGKTTTARILARALNYRTPAQDQPSIDMPEPGEHCAAIMEGRHVDVFELDAASHTGIDDIRDIIDQVRYAPVSARYKVYIIDEVHMLSNQAFNGLLKTLEEPPPHVKFIFATTEIRKVPITVLSRCQRFDLRRVEPSVLSAHLSGIAAKEGIEVAPEALSMIVRAAEGSVRDSLSILDQAIAHGGERVAAADVRDMLGLADRARIVDLFEHVMKGDVATALAEFRVQYDAGADPVAILTDLAEFNHLVTRLRFVPSLAGDNSLTAEERERGARLAQTLSIRVLSRTWQMLLKGITEVQGSNRPVMAAEMVLIRLAHAAELPTLDEALKQVASTDRSASGPAARPSPASGGSAAPAAQTVAVARAPVGTTTGGAARTMRLVDPAAELPAPEPERTVVPEPETAPAEQVRIASLADIANLADARRDLAFKVMFKRCVRLVGIEPGRLSVALTPDAPKTLLGDLTSRLSDWTGRRWMVSVSQAPGGRTLAEEESERRNMAFLDARADPAVAAILARFPGARIIDVRLPDAAVDTTLDPLTPVEPEADDEQD